MVGEVASVCVCSFAPGDRNASKSVQTVRCQSGRSFTRAYNTRIKYIDLVSHEAGPI